MRFMVIVKANKDSEAGKLPTEAELLQMGTFNEQLIKAGVMLAGDGLHPTSKGARIKFGGAKPAVTDGPFAEAKELIAGYWIVQMKSKAECIEWFTRCPMQAGDEIEIRQLFEAADFAPQISSDAGKQLLADEQRFRETH
jgi:hypothetical protein